MAKSRRDEVIVGLDIGTTKVCAIVGQANAEGIDIIGIGTHPSRGLKKGMVVNVDETVGSIRHAIEEAELMAGPESPPPYPGGPRGGPTRGHTHGGGARPGGRGRPAR